MFGVRRRNPLADKTRFSGLSLHHGFLPLGGCRRLQIRQLQCLQDPARVRAASADPATLRSIVHAKRHQAYRLERLHRPPPRASDPPPRRPPNPHSVVQTTYFPPTPSPLPRPAAFPSTGSPPGGSPRNSSGSRG